MTIVRRYGHYSFNFAIIFDCCVKILLLINFLLLKGGRRLPKEAKERTFVLVIKKESKGIIPEDLSCGLGFPLVD